MGELGQGPATVRFVRRAAAAVARRGAVRWHLARFPDGTRADGPDNAETGVPSGSAVVLAVYRRRNAAILRQFLGRLGMPADVRLWALDEVEPELATWTAGVGAGGKFELVNRLYRHRPVPAASYVMVADDDALLAKGTVSALVEVMQRASFDMAAPAHNWYSYHWLPATRRRLGARATRTRLVEIGPVFVVAPSWRTAVLPFPEDVGMGWSIQSDWVDLERQGCRFGVVDAVRIIHCFPAGRRYDIADEVGRCADRRAELGISEQEWDSVKRTTEPWHRWRSRPPWPS